MNLKEREEAIKRAEALKEETLAQEKEQSGFKDKEELQGDWG